MASFIYTIGNSADLSASANVSLTISATATNRVSLAPPPAPLSAQNFNPVELGVEFQSPVAATITAICFYMVPQNPGTHVANLWTSGGMLLASETFSVETARGWQQLTLPIGNDRARYDLDRNLPPRATSTPKTSISTPRRLPTVR